jgi:hypothetical protein
MISILRLLLLRRATFIAQMTDSLVHLIPALERDFPQQWACT